MKLFWGRGIRRFGQNSHDSVDMLRAAQGHVQSRRIGKSVGPLPGSLLMLKHPLSDSLLRARDWKIVRCPAFEGDLAGDVRKEDDDPAAKYLSGDIGCEPRHFKVTVFTGQFSREPV